MNTNWAPFPILTLMSCFSQTQDRTPKCAHFSDNSIGEYKNSRPAMKWGLLFNEKIGTLDLSGQYRCLHPVFGLPFTPYARSADTQHLMHKVRD
jgi:hypothetical protein